jgi:CRISPR-associated protein Csb2
MASHFGLSIRFLDPAFHGRRDGGAPEWPPSPLRVFQSLVAAAAARWRAEALAPLAQSALRWLEAQVVPTLIAPSVADGRVASGYCLSVPNNAMDVVAKAWCRGNDSNSGDANPATHRTMKNVRPTRLLGGDTVHYLWALADPLTEEVRGHVSALCDIARGMVALGWGVDMVVAHGAIASDEQAGALSGERWLPSAEAADDGLRVPARGTLDALIQRHERFLSRLRPDGVFTPPPPLSSYLTFNYRRATDPAPSPVAAFSLLQVDASGFRAFDTARSALTVAGMMRHATRLAATRSGWPEPKINAFILGHGESKGDAKHLAVGPRRFAYLPLPSIERRGQGKTRIASVRRGLVTAFADGCEAEITWARRTLSGQPLIDESKKQPVSLLSQLPATDNVVRQYTRLAATWATVTPVVVPGYDDPSHYRRRLKRATSADEQKRLLDCLSERIEALLRKAITQAGFSAALAAHADLEWRKVGFWPGSDLADRYGVPNHIRRFPRYHVRLHWRDENEQPVQVAGPVCLGAGRFLGLGLFAAF